MFGVDFSSKSKYFENNFGRIKISITFAVRFAKRVRTSAFYSERKCFKKQALKFLLSLKSFLKNASKNFKVSGY
jgi:hypothetical protein